MQKAKPQRNTSTRQLQKINKWNETTDVAYIKRRSQKKPHIWDKARL